MRASTAVLSPLLARQHRALVAMPGGDFLGPRPIDLHLKGLEALGAEIKVVHGVIDATMRRTARRRRPVRLAEPRRDGEHHHRRRRWRRGRRSSRTPRAIRRSSTSRRSSGRWARASRATGRPRSRSKASTSSRPSTYEVMPDRLEAGTFLFATAATGGEVTVNGHAAATHLEIVLEKLTEMGAGLEVGDDCVRITMDGRPRAIDIATLPYPGFPTDLQAMALAVLHARGRHVDRHGERLRRAVRVHGRARAHGRRRPCHRTPRGRPRRRRTHGRPGARARRERRRGARDRRRSRRPAGRPSRTSSTSTVATRTSRASSPRSARRSNASRTRLSARPHNRVVALFPSPEWLVAYADAIEASDELRASGARVGGRHHARRRGRAGQERPDRCLGVVRPAPRRLPRREARRRRTKASARGT